MTNLEIKSTIERSLTPVYLDVAKKNTAYIMDQKRMLGNKEVSISKMISSNTKFDLDLIIGMPERLIKEAYEDQAIKKVNSLVKQNICKIRKVGS